MMRIDASMWSHQRLVVCSYLVLRAKTKNNYVLFIIYHFPFTIYSSLFTLFYSVGDFFSYSTGLISLPHIERTVIIEIDR